MIGTAFLVSAAAAATPCESLAVRLTDATITSAGVVPEVGPPARGAG